MSEVIEQEFIASDLGGGFTTKAHVGYIGLIGPANAGKSTLLNGILGKKISIVSPKAHTTRQQVLGVKTLPDAQLIFVDTPGFVSGQSKGALEPLLNQALVRALGDVDLRVLVVDSAKLAKHSSELETLFEVLKKKHIENLSIVVLNKIDSIDKRELLPIISRLQTELGSEITFLPVSALNGEGLSELEREIAKRLPEGPQYFPDDMVTDMPEGFLVAEIIREKLFYKLQQELPYSLTVVVEGIEEKNDIAMVRARILVERDSQKSIVIGKGGSMLKSVGIQARMELEKMFGMQVHLQLFVKVEKDWTRTSKGLERAGLIERE